MTRAYVSLRAMKQKMATRSPKGKSAVLECITDFVLHKTQRCPTWADIRSIIDFTEQKLLRLMDSMDDAQQKLVLAAMLDDYISGEIAVAWQRGSPCYIRVTKGT